MSDTIIALATPPGVSARALLRISGPDATTLTDRLLRKPITWKTQRTWHREFFEEGNDQPLEEVTLTFWKGPGSFSGEDTVEISSHGNPFLIQRIIAAYLRMGARPAGPGEFTQRAFLNGKIDLTQAEAIADLIAAATDREIAGAQAMRAGRLGERMQELRTRLIDLLANLEAYIDFPDEDISPETGSAFAKRVGDVLAEVERLIATAPLGRILRQGIVTAIVGAPNVGKSSLFNALLREDRAIVSPLPGTTRDVIETECQLGGFRLRLLDTAGQRETGDLIEAEGVRRAASAALKADLVLHLIEASIPASKQPAPFSPGTDHPPVLTLASKCDLGLAPENQAAGLLAISTVTGAGLDHLPEKIEALLLQATNSFSASDPLTVNTRQESALRTAQAALQKAMEGLGQNLAPELVSIALREALRAIGEVVGLATDDDILDALFKKFCIGK